MSNRFAGRIVTLAAAICLSVCAAAFAQQAKSRLKVLFFFSQSCHICHEVREEILVPLERRFAGRVEMEYRDIAEVDNYRLLLGLKNERNPGGDVRVPSVAVADLLLTGKEAISGRLEQALELELSHPFLRQTRMVYADLVKHFQAFTPLTVVGAGLVDGINPCAFTVIIFFISFLAVQGYSRRELAVIGGGFVFAVFLTYFAVGLGLFSVFYGFKAVWLLRRVFNIVIGVFTLVLGAVSLADIYRYKKSGAFTDVALQLPKAVKEQIHKVIGLHYRRSRQIEEPLPKPGLARLLVSAVVTGFLVSLLEAVCTGQVYLPTITFVMKTSHLRWEAYGYLLLYNVMFILPLVAIFLMALLGVSSADFSRFFRRHFLLSKALLAAVFFVLGGILIWKA